MTGSPSQVIKNEQTSVTTIVVASTWKNAPATPLINENGMKMTIVLSDDPTMAGNR